MSEKITPVNEAIRKIAKVGKTPKTVTKPSKARDSGTEAVEPGWVKPTE